MRFYSIGVHTAVDTKVRCKKQSLSLADLEVQDLVTIEGSTNHHGSGNENHYPPRLATLPGNQRFKTMSLQMLKQAFKAGVPAVVCMSLAVPAALGQSTVIGDFGAIHRGPVRLERRKNLGFRR